MGLKEKSGHVCVIESSGGIELGRFTLTKWLVNMHAWFSAERFQFELVRP